MQPLDLGEGVISEDDSISDSSNGFSASDSNKSDSEVEIAEGDKGKDLAKAANDALSYGAFTAYAGSRLRFKQNRIWLLEHQIWRNLHQNRSILYLSWSVFY